MNKNTTTPDIYEYPREFYSRIISKRVGAPKRIRGVKGPSEILKKYVEMKLSLHQAVGYHVSFIRYADDKESSYFRFIPRFLEKRDLRQVTGNSKIK